MRNISVWHIDKIMNNIYVPPMFRDLVSSLNIYNDRVEKCESYIFKVFTLTNPRVES
jgi:hypothetical protein